MAVAPPFDPLHLVGIHQNAKCFLEYLIVLLRLETQTSGEFFRLEGLIRVPGKKGQYCCLNSFDDGSSV